MANNVVISNTFATQSGNVPASQLDTNFSQLATALNSLGSFANYYVDSGSVNAIVITVPSPLVVSYAAGLPLQIKVAVTNTGATTINVNGLGAVNLVYPGSAGAMVASQLTAGGIYSVMYDGTNFQFLGSISSTTGVTSIIAGTGISVNASTGNVTVTNTGSGYTTGSFTGALTGLTSSINVSVNYTINGTICTLYSASGNNGTSNSSTMTMTGLPSAVQTANSQFASTTMIDNGSFVVGTGYIASGTSTIYFGKLVVSGTNVTYDNPSSFTSSGTKGLPIEWIMTYPLN